MGPPLPAAVAQWRKQMEREQDFPPYFTPELKAKRDKRFQAWLLLHVRCLDKAPGGGK